jgi:hypothetical protein
MYKTKLGMTNCMAAGIIFLLALITSFQTSSIIFAWPFVLLVAFVLVKENDLWLKASAIKAVLVLVAFLLIPICFSFIYNIMDFINFFLNLADVQAISDGYDIIGFFINIFNIIEKVVLLILALLAFKGKTIKLPVIDSAIRKHLA